MPPQPSSRSSFDERAQQLVGLIMIGIAPVVLARGRRMLPSNPGFIRSLRPVIPSTLMAAGGLQMAGYLPSVDADLQRRRLTEMPLPWYGYLMIPLLAYPNLAMGVMRPPTLQQCLGSVIPTIRRLPQSIPNVALRMVAATVVSTELYRTISSQDRGELLPSPEWPGAALTLYGGTLALAGATGGALVQAGARGFVARRMTSLPGMVAFLSGALIMDRSRGLYFDSDVGSLGYGRLGSNGETGVQVASGMILTTAALARLFQVTQRAATLGLRAGPRGLPGTFWSVASAIMASYYAASTTSQGRTHARLIIDMENVRRSSVHVSRGLPSPDSSSPQQQAAFTAMRGVALAPLLSSLSWRGFYGGSLLVSVTEAAIAASTIRTQRQQGQVVIELGQMPDEIERR